MSLASQRRIRQEWRFRIQAVRHGWDRSRRVGSLSMPNAWVDETIPAEWQDRLMSTPLSLDDFMGVGMISPDPVLDKREWREGPWEFTRAIWGREAMERERTTRAARAMGWAVDGA